VTKGLSSLEIINTGDQREGDKSQPFSAALSTLESSQGSLKHLRVLGFDASLDAQSADDGVFKTLKLLCLGYSSLAHLAAKPQQQLLSSLNVIYFPYFLFEDSRPQVGEVQEEVLFGQLLGSRNVPNLKIVAVPMSCWDQSYREAVSPRN